MMHYDKQCSPDGATISFLYCVFNCLCSRQRARGCWCNNNEPNKNLRTPVSDLKIFVCRLSLKKSVLGLKNTLTTTWSTVTTISDVEVK